MVSAAFKEEKFKEKERRLKNTSNRFLYTFLTIFFVGYFVFFSSSLWLPKSYTGVDVTPIGTGVKGNNRIVTVDRWVYSPVDKEMEIIVEIENNSIDGLTDYTWQLRDKNGLIKTEVVAEDETLAIIRGKNIKRGWAEVSLTLSVNTENEDVKFTPIVIYMNDKVAPVEDGLIDRTMEEYRLLAYESKVDSFNSLILSKNEEIAGKEAEIGEINKRIDELVERLNHQTEQEKETTSSLITSLSQQEKNLLNEVEKIREEITEIEKKIEITESILEGLKK